MICDVWCVHPALQKARVHERHQPLGARDCPHEGVCPLPDEFCQPVHAHHPRYVYLPLPTWGEEVVWVAKPTGRRWVRTTSTGQGRLGIQGKKPPASAFSQYLPWRKPHDQALLEAEGEVCCTSGTTPFQESFNSQAAAPQVQECAFGISLRHLC